MQKDSAAGTRPAASPGAAAKEILAFGHGEKQRKTEIQKSDSSVFLCSLLFFSVSKEL
jgi:hypothetical protein